MRTAACLLTLVLLAPAPVFGQPLDEGTRNAARALASEGDQLLEKGDYASAADRFGRAHALIPAPTIGVRWARALARLGKLIEAEERYIEVVRTDLAPDAPDAFRLAVSEATSELAELRARIPRLEITRPEGVGAVRMDGTPVPDVLIGVRRPVNPGPHVIEADGARTVELTLRESEVVRVALEPLDGGGQSTQRTAGWVAIGISGIGLGAGLFAGAMALSSKSTLDERCAPDGACPVAAEPELDAYRSAGTVSTIGFVVAGVGGVAGALLLLTDSSGSAAARAPRSRAMRLGAELGPGYVGLRGAF